MCKQNANGGWTFFMSGKLPLRYSTSCVHVSSGHERVLVYFIFGITQQLMVNF